MKVKPVTPRSVTKLKLETIPNEVIEAFNELIAEKFNGYSVQVKQNEAIDLIKKKIKKACGGNQLITNEEIFGHGWLDIEPIYRKAGWKVEYVKPAFNEDFDAYFTFEKR